MYVFRSVVLSSSLVIGLCYAPACSRPKADSPPVAEIPSFSLSDFKEEYDHAKLVTWLAGPTVGSKAHNRLRLTFVRADGSVPASVGRVRFWPYMSIHGHGSPHKGIVTPTADPHVYEVSKFVFTMGGKWELEIRVSLEGKAYALSIPVHVPES